MNRISTGIIGFFLISLTSQITLAQGIGEYGRVLGGAKQGRAGVGPKTPQVGTQKGKGVFHGVGELKGRPFPTQLVVVAKAAALYPRQDDETEQIEKLVQGEILVPMAQSTTASNEWYMVKTRLGTIGWIKASDVKEPPSKQP